MTDERAARGVRADAREHRIADRDQRVLHLEAVPPLHFVARERPQRLAHEVPVRDLDDGVRILLVAPPLTVVLKRSMNSGTASRRRATPCGRETRSSGCPG